MKIYQKFLRFGISLAIVQIIGVVGMLIISIIRYGWKNLDNENL